MNSNDYHQSVRKPKSSILIIWIIPFIALIIAASLIAKHFLDKGEEITIVFKGAEGFTIGKTPLNYKGIKVGIVSNIKINEKNSREFLVTVTVDNSAVSLIEKKGTKFWKVEPKISLSEVSGLSTIISGSYIEMLPGKGTFRELNRRDYFIAERSKPIASYQDGFFINLQSDRGDLSDGAPLLYEKYAIGKVVKKELKKEKFLYTIFVNEKYGDLIKEDSHFWNVSSVEFEAALS
ncbi:MAG: MlaD family protein, partial [Thiovulaceae bacterium]|nr:MlaD family protein [Sulfurimonadaceae bacterium]